MSKEKQVGQSTAKTANEKVQKLLSATLAENKKLREANERLRSRALDAELQIEPKSVEFVVGDCGSVSINPDQDDWVELTLLTYNLTVDEEITTTHITPEQAFGMGNALLQVARLYGYVPLQPQTP